MELMTETLTKKNGSNSMGYVITIDGPAASGKSSVSRELASRLSCPWVSTGAFYRGLAFAAHALGTPLQDEAALAALSQSADWKIKMTPQRTEVYFKAKNVTDEISHENIGNIASLISHYPEVRKALLAAQRACSNSNQGLVAEGRDCGTVVFPHAELKIYLTADSEHRAERRAKELGLSKTDMAAAQKIRDKQDSTRKAAPLQIPDQALVIDNSLLSLEEVVDLIVEQVRKRLGDQVFID